MPIISQLEKQKQGTSFGGLIAKSPPSNSGDVGLIPGQRTRIPHAVGQLNLHTITNKPSHHNWREDCKPQLRLNAELNKLRKSCPPIAYIPVSGDSNKIIYMSMKKISVCSGLYSEISIHPLYLLGPLFLTYIMRKYDLYCIRWRDALGEKALPSA